MKGIILAGGGRRVSPISASATYGQYFGVTLSEENHKQFYISEGFAHGFLVLCDDAKFCYKVTDFYHPGDESGMDLTTYLRICMSRLVYWCLQC